MGLEKMAQECQLSWHLGSDLEVTQETEKNVWDLHTFRLENPDGYSECQNQDRFHTCESDPDDCDYTEELFLECNPEASYGFVFQLRNDNGIVADSKYLCDLLDIMIAAFPAIMWVE